MKVPVLKALANPARIFFVPYNLAVFNFMILLLIYMSIFMPTLIISRGLVAVNPMYFLLTLIFTHSVLAAWTRKEPFLLKILMANISLIKRNIPKRLPS